MATNTASSTCSEKWRTSYRALLFTAAVAHNNSLLWFPIRGSAEAHCWLRVAPAHRSGYLPIQQLSTTTIWLSFKLRKPAGSVCSIVRTILCSSADSGRCTGLRIRSFETISPSSLIACRCSRHRWNKALISGAFLCEYGPDGAQTGCRRNCHE